VTVVLLHALPLDERMWAPQQEMLTGQDVAAPNLYGLGSSMDAWADGVLAAVDGPFVAVGASMGGYCALAIAGRAPDRLQGLLITGSRAGADTPERRAGRADTIRLIRDGGAKALWEDMRPKLFPEDARPEVVAEARRLALAQARERLVAAVEAIRDRDDSTGVVHALRVPFLVVVGTRDPFISVDEAREIAGAAPNGRSVVLDGAGHLPNLERPEEFNRELSKLLTEVG
jgi:pimeloyl-ACP methyl ester carboxylesterase